VEAHLSKTGMTLSEAINHSKLIGYLNCRICGCLMTDNYNRVEMVNALRNDGLCSSCHFDLYSNNNQHNTDFS
jgi:hypothetical protein